MRYRLVIFDFDGTLADSFPWFLRVINGVAERYRFRRIEPGETAALRSLGARDLMRHLGIPAWKMPLIANHMRKLKARDIDATRPFPGVEELLQSLSAHGLTLAVVSSNSEANVRAVLGPASAARISHYECGASMFGKPARFRRVLRRAGVTAAEAIAIGDEIRDSEAARSAGIDFAAVAWGYTTPEALAAQGPAAMFSRVEDIAAALCSRAAAG